MIKVAFKSQYEDKFYEDRLYTYKDFKGAEIGDIVVVNTKAGFAIAKVIEKDIVDTKINPEILNSVFTIILKQEDIEKAEIEEYNRKIKYNNLIKKARERKMKDELAKVLSNQDIKDIEDISYDDLVKLYNAICK